MLKLRDLFHLPQVDDLVKRLVTDEPGMILLAGIDARRPANPSGDVFKPSGLSAFFNILMQEILLANPEEQAVIIAQDKTLSRVPRAIKRRTRFVKAEPPFSYQGQIELAIVDRPGLLVIDHLNEDALQAAFRAAQNGIRVLTQTDTVMRGASVARQLVDRGLSQDMLPALRWVVCSHRMAVLCKRCKKPVKGYDEMLERFRSRILCWTVCLHKGNPLKRAQHTSFTRPAGARSAAARAIRAMYRFLTYFAMILGRTIYMPSSLNFLSKNTHCIWQQPATWT